MTACALMIQAGYLIMITALTGFFRNITAEAVLVL
jgi:hypothetical protein